jgi:hypothetical protein
MTKYHKPIEDLEENKCRREEERAQYIKTKIAGSRSSAC